MEYNVVMMLEIGYSGNTGAIPTDAVDSVQCTQGLNCEAYCSPAAVF